MAKKSREYPYCVMDCNQAEDVRFAPYSVHMEARTAMSAAAKLNTGDPNSHYEAFHWRASTTAREFWPCLIRADQK